MSQSQAIAELIYRSCLSLDAKDFDAYLALCDPQFHYAITANSPEIRKEMIWLEHDKAGLKLLFDNLPKHNSDHSTLMRHATVYTITPEPGSGSVRVVTALQVFKTALDGGSTELFAVGKLLDTVKVDGGTTLLLDRNVRLETRMFGFGFHIPF